MVGETLLQCLRSALGERGQHQPALTSIVVGGVHWVRGNDVARALGYKNLLRAIRAHVSKDSRKTLQSLIGASAPTHRNQDATIYIDEAGVKQLVVKSQLPGASGLAKQLGIKEDTRYLRKEIEIVSFIQEVLTQAMIPFEFQKRVFSYKIDLFLPSHKLAIEIDEQAHAGRDAAYEGVREQRIREELG